MPHLTQCDYPDCARFQALNGQWLCRGDGDALALCSSGDAALSIHLLFAGRYDVPWPGHGHGDFFVEDNTCDAQQSEDRKGKCYLQHFGCGQVAQPTLRWQAIGALDACFFTSCDSWRFEAEEVHDASEHLYRLYSNCSHTSRYLSTMPPPPPPPLSSPSSSSSAALSHGLYFGGDAGAALQWRVACGQCPSTTAPWYLILVAVLTGLFSTLPSLADAYQHHRSRRRRAARHDVAWPFQESSLRARVSFQIGWAWCLILAVLDILSTSRLYVVPQWVRYAHTFGTLFLLLSLRPSVVDAFRLRCACYMFSFDVGATIYAHVPALDLLLKSFSPLDSSVMRVGKAGLATTQVTWLLAMSALFTFLVLLLVLASRTEEPRATELLHARFMGVTRGFFVFTAFANLLVPVGVLLTINAIDNDDPVWHRIITEQSFYAIFGFSAPSSLVLLVTHPRVRIYFHFLPPFFRRSAPPHAQSLPPDDSGSGSKNSSRPASRDGSAAHAAEPHGQMLISDFTPSDQAVDASLFVGFELGEEVGRGGYGCVYMAHLPTGAPSGAGATAASGGGGGLQRPPRCAVKVLFLSRSYSREQRMLAALQNEMRVLKEVEHANVVRALGTCIVSSAGGARFPSLVMELVSGGSLDTFLHGPKGSGRHAGSGDTHRATMEITPSLQRGFALDVARGLAHLHRQGVMHRDIKPANVLLDLASTPRPTAKVADFGLATRTDMEAMFATKKVGTFRYMAPEVYFGKYERSADIYSFGILLWEVVSTQTPFPKMSKVDVAVAVTMKHLRPTLTAEGRSGGGNSGGGNSGGGNSGNASTMSTTRPSPSPSPGPGRPTSPWMVAHLELAAACWHQTPSARPDMGSVVHQLESLQHASSSSGVPSSSTSSAAATTSTVDVQILTEADARGTNSVK